MRDQHRSKQDLINEVVALRKQVADLREASAARRRVEDALRQSEEELTALIDGSPVGLCVLRLDGAPISANRPMARILGYDSPAELLSIGTVLGLFASSEELARVVEGVRAGEYCEQVGFRRKDGSRHTCWATGRLDREQESIGLALLEELSVPSIAGTHWG
jgi:PAS domain S-box-containing protein